MITVTACTASSSEEARSPSGADLEARINDYLEQRDEYDKVRAVLVYESGDPVLEMYRGDDAHDYRNVFSVTKSVVATLIGIAIDEGLIAGVDSTLGELLPNRRAEMSDEVAAIPLESVLTHTAGFAAENEWDFADDDAVGAIIADRVTRGPGDGSFAYSNAGSHMMAAILDHATGGTVLEFAREHLFDPLGIDSEPAWVKTDWVPEEQRAAVQAEYLAADFAWPVDGQGVPTGWAFMKLTPDDLVKLGLLYLADGEWEGEQVVSAAWVREATRAHVDTFNTPDGYGYQWWTHGEGDDAMFFALGFGGMVVAVMPERDLVAVVASEFDLADPLATTEKFDVSEAVSLVQYVILGQDE